MKWTGLLLLLLLHLLLLNNLTFTAWPEMLSYPYLLSNNFTLYKDFIIPYPPLLILILKFIFEVFGYSVETLRIFTWVLILSLDFIFFLILKTFTNRKIVIYGFLFIFILLQSFLEGNMLWFDFATVIPICLALLFSIKWTLSQNKKYLYLVGFSLGVGLLIKQIVLIYILFFTFFLLIFSFRKIISNTIFFSLGILTFLTPFLIYLLFSDSLIYFLNWAFFYPLTWWSKFPGYVDFEISLKWILITGLVLAPVLWIIFIIKKIPRNYILMLNFLFLIAAILAIYPRFSFFHLQPTIALAVLLFAQIYLLLNQKFQRLYLVFISMAVFIIMYFTYPLQKGNSIRFYDNQQKSLTQRIIQETNQDKKIYLLGLISSQYVFSNKIPPKNWSDNFGWYLEIPGIQDWVLEGITKDNPQVIFREIPNQGEWYELGVYQPKKIIDYISKNYEKKETFNNIEIWKIKN